MRYCTTSRAQLTIYLKDKTKECTTPYGVIVTFAYFNCMSRLNVLWCSLPSGTCLDGIVHTVLDESLQSSCELGLAILSLRKSHKQNYFTNTDMYVIYIAVVTIYMDIQLLKIHTVP